MDLVEAKARGFEAGVRHPWEQARIDVIGKLVRRHVALERGSIVVDVGCGDTFVAERLAAIYTDVVFYAIDTAFTAEFFERNRARSSNPRLLLFSSLDAIAPAPEKPASLVLLTDVIEHINDDRAFLAGLRERPWVGPDTKFLITVPAYQALFCSHDAFLGHYRRYSNRQLRARVEESGFTVIDAGYFFLSLLLIRAPQVLKERVFGLRPKTASSGLVTWNGGATKAAILRQVLVLDADISALLGRFGIRLAGLSNYAICAKSVESFPATTKGGRP